jgi:serine/threonine-protein kinase HipA
MTKITLQIYLNQQWHDAAEVAFSSPEQGHKGPARLDYLAPYVIEHMGTDDINGAVISSRYPVDFTSHAEAHWPAFLLDLLPGGEGQRRWAERLGIGTGINSELALLQHAAANPAGNIRIKESVESEYRLPAQLPDEQGQLQPIEQHPGFARDNIIQKQEHFIEYAYNLGAAVAGASDVQGEAPKFLLVEDLQDNWHAEGALPDEQIKKHWIVKFARGKTAAEQQVLRNEAGYLEVARQFGLTVGEALHFENGALFIPRFDRIQQDNGTAPYTERIAMESLYAVAGIAEYGVATPHEILVEALMEKVVAEDRPATAQEYIKRDLLNVVMGNTDNHGRNTAILRNRNGRITLSPLFDFAPMYLDPEGIARVSRWGKDKEQAGRPSWHEVARFFTPWVDENWLLEQLAALAHPLAELIRTMQAVGIDDDIIERRQPAIENNLNQLLSITNNA